MRPCTMPGDVRNRSTKGGMKIRAYPWVWLALMKKGPRLQFRVVVKPWMEAIEGSQPEKPNRPRALLPVLLSAGLRRSRAKWRCVRYPATSLGGRDRTDKLYIAAERSRAQVSRASQGCDALSSHSRRVYRFLPQKPPS